MSAPPRRTRIKICGITSVDAAQVAVEAGADAIGLVFAERSPRRLTYAQAIDIVLPLPSFVEPVGVFADQPVDEIVRIAGRLGLRTIQLHGGETIHDAEKLRPLRIIRALPFEAADAAERARAWSDTRANVCGLLWDTPDTKPGGGVRGGAGIAFDWDAFGRLAGTGAFDGLPPSILAGGLTPQNVAEAIRSARPYAVDVSSGVESSPGVKDPARVRAFCAAVGEA